MDSYPHMHNTENEMDFHYLQWQVVLQLIYDVFYLGGGGGGNETPSIFL